MKSKRERKCLIGCTLAIYGKKNCKKYGLLKEQVSFSGLENLPRPKASTF